MHPWTADPRTIAPHKIPSSYLHLRLLPPQTISSKYFPLDNSSPDICPPPFPMKFPPGQVQRGLLLPRELPLNNYPEDNYL